MKSVNIGLLIAIAVAGIVGLSLLAAGGLGSSMSSYSTFESAKKTGDYVHVAGKWVRQSEAKYDAEADVFSFYLEDSTHKVELVAFTDPMPVNFQSADKIVITGKYKGEEFVADKILMKCPSKYNATEITEEQMSSQP